MTWRMATTRKPSPAARLVSDGIARVAIMKESLRKFGISIVVKAAVKV